jgi:adenylate kinase
VSEILFKNLAHLDAFFVDGYPRDRAQAQALDAFLEKQNLPLTHAIFFAVDAEFLLQRVIARYICAGCGAPYATGFNEPAVAGKCDYCDSETFSQRADDQEDVARERLLRSQARDKIVLEYYAERGILHTMDGSQSVATLTKALCDLLKSEEQTGLESLG